MGEILTVKERDPYLCAAGSFFFPGLGQVYCGRILRGVVFLIPAVLLTIPHSLNLLIVAFRWSPPEIASWLQTWYAFITPIDRTIDLIVRVIATYDAYRIAKHTHIQQ